MPSYPTNADLVHEFGSLKRRVNRLETRESPVAAGSSAYCAIGFSADYNLPPYPLPTSPSIGSYNHAFPFDTEVVNVGGFNINWTYDVGAAIAVPADGWYRLGFTGKFFWQFDVLGGASSPGIAGTVEGNEHYFGVGVGAVWRQPLPWGRISDGTNWHPLKPISSEFDSPFLNLITGPVHLTPTDWVETWLDVTDGDTIVSMTMSGEESHTPVRLWIEAL